MTPTPNREDFRTLAYAIGVSALAGFLYFLTAARDIVVGDTPELITVAAILGVAHPPGYPLFTMLGHLFSLLPLGSIPFRINLLSVVCDALTVGVVFLTAFRLSRSRLASAMAALTLALNPLFWSWSLVAEVFPLNNLLVSLVIYLLVIWHDEPERIRVLAIAGFIAGLAFTNHQTIVLLIPAVCFVLWQRRAALWAKPRILPICLLAFLLGLVPYAYVLWAAAHHPAYNWGNVSSFGDLFALVTRQSYGSGHLVSEIHRGGSMLHRLLSLFLSLGALINLLALLGLVYAYRHRRWYFWFSLLAFVFAGPFFAALTNLNLGSAPQALFVLERFFLLPEVIVAPLVALGIAMIAEFVASSAPTLPVRPVPLISGAIAVVLAVSLITNYKRIDQSDNRIARTYAEDVFNTIEPNTILFVTGDGLSLPLLYLNLVERVRPDVTLIFPLLLPADWYVRQLRERYPNLIVPFEYYDAKRNNLRMLTAANLSRPIAVIGTLQDSSLDHDYQPYPYGLVNLVEPRSKRITVSEMVNDNMVLMSRYRPPPHARISAKSFESEILLLYTQPAWRIGHEYERVDARTGARAWYRHALVLNPNFSQARQGLVRLDRADGKD